MSTELNKENIAEQELLGPNQQHKHGLKPMQKNSSSGNGASRKFLEVSNKISSKQTKQPLFGKTGFGNIVGNKKAPNGKISIFKDEKPSTTDDESQTELTDSDILELESNVQFYKDLAEKRREALDESLKENEELHIENEEQKQKIESLEETIEQTKKIIDMISPCLFEDEEGKEDTEGNNEPPSGSESDEKVKIDSSEANESSNKKENSENLESALEKNDN